MTSSSHRSNEDVFVRRVILHPDPVAEDRSAGEGRARIYAQDGDIVERVIHG